MSAPCDELPERSGLDVVEIDEGNAATTYVLTPADATDGELKTMWLRFEKSDSISLWENR